MANQNFKEQLEKLMQTDNTIRPFICDGDPQKSELFFVGINPAT